MVTIRISPVPILLVLLFLLHLDYFGYVNLFRRRLELSRGFHFVWTEKHIEHAAPSSYQTQARIEEVDTDYVSIIIKEKELKQIKMFRELENWCELANYSSSLPLPAQDELAAIHRKEDVWDELQNTALIITSNFPWKSIIGLLQRMYQPYFRVTIFCGTFYSEQFLKDEGFPPITAPFNYINISEAEMLQGYLAYICLVKAKYLHSDDVEGFFVMSDDATFNFWHTLILSKVMHPTGITFKEYTGMWWPSPYGKQAVQLALMLITEKYRNSLSIQKMWKKYQDGLIGNGFMRSAHQQLTEIDGWCMSDLFYVPSTQLQYFTDLMIIFFEARVFHEIAISKFLYTVPHSSLDPSEYKYLWGADRDKWAELYDESLVLLHPVKFSLLTDLDQRSRFCNTVVRTFKKALFDGIGIAKTLH